MRQTAPSTHALSWVALVLAVGGALVTVGCADAGRGPDATSAGLDTASLALLDGSPQGEGILAFLNDPSTSFEVLDVEVGLDRRAAEHLIAWRDGADGVPGTADDDLFDSLEEVDDVYWVGATAIALLKAFTSEQGWVPAGDDLLGTWVGVTFTALEANLVVELPNRSPFVVLDVDVQLDKRAVEAIFAARPVGTAKDLAAVKYVGTASLERMKAFGLARFHGQ